MHKEFTILEDIIVHSVPDGIRTTLEKGKKGIISQSLGDNYTIVVDCLLYTSPSPRDRQKSRMPSSA